MFSKFTAFYAFCVGVLMLAMWTFFLIAGMVGELETRPAEIVLHLVAEFSTAVMLILSGILMLRRAFTGALLAPFAMGMLVYTIILSPGYYIQRGETAFVAMFTVLLIATIGFLVYHLKHVAYGGKGSPVSIKYANNGGFNLRPRFRARACAVRALPQYGSVPYHGLRGRRLPLHRFVAPASFCWHTPGRMSTVRPIFL